MPHGTGRQAAKIARMPLVPPTSGRPGLVIFDLDNTLIDRDGAFRRWSAEFVSGNGLDPGEHEWLAHVDGGGFAPRLAFMSQVKERYRLGEPAERLLDDFRNRMVAHTTPYPSVPASLDLLRNKGWRVAIATNGEAIHQREKIRRAGLTGSVDAIVVSEEVGVAKPDRRMFETAAGRCGGRLADGGWMVGDCPIRDIAGGRAAGLRTIWMRHGRTWDPTTPAPDAIVDTPDQVTNLLGGVAGDLGSGYVRHSPMQDPSLPHQAGAVPRTEV
jgi:putative hydrolase of the HAD superfamily